MYFIYCERLPKEKIIYSWKSMLIVKRVKQSQLLKFFARTQELFNLILRRVIGKVHWSNNSLTSHTALVVALMKAKKAITASFVGRCKLDALAASLNYVQLRGLYQVQQSSNSRPDVNEACWWAFQFRSSALYQPPNLLIFAVTVHNAASNTSPIELYK